MAITAGATTAFFTDAAQMGLTPETRARLVTEGIKTVDDLVENDAKTIKSIAENLRRPGGRIPDPANGPNDIATIPQPPFTFGARSQHRLAEACDLLRFYETIGREVTAGNIRFTNVIKNFSEQWRSLTERISGTRPDTPKITKELGILR